MKQFTIHEISELANEFLERQWDLTHYEALSLAVNVHRNELIGASEETLREILEHLQNTDRK